MDISDILQAAVSYGASDVHIVPGRSPFLRINGEMKSLDTPAMSSKETRQIIFATLSDKQIQTFDKENELDTSLTADDIGRFRMNVLNQKDGIGAVLRVIPSKIPNPEDLGLSETAQKLTELARGLVLVTGPTGSGKSTTLASMINLINQRRKQHILTIEDPVEYVYPKSKCVVTQREIGPNSKSFKASLKRAMRQDPDIILVGEMRDLETIAAALTLAETGHLVFATLHTTDAAQTVDRIIDVFPPYQQQQVRTQLSVTLKAVICQQLLPRNQDKGRVAARELMIVTPAIANLIREGQTHQIYSAIDVGSKFGMKSLDRDLANLVEKGMISMETALAKANNPNLLQSFIQGAGKA